MLKPQRSAMQPGNLFRDRQTETGARLNFVDAPRRVDFIEKILKIL